MDPIRFREPSAPISIPPFPVGTIVSNEFRWLGPENWLPDHLEYLAQQRSLHLEGLLRTPTALRKQKMSSASFGRWILTDGGPKNPSSRPIGWAETHGFQSSFTKTWLFLEHNHSEVSENLLTSSIRTLISAVFLAEGADLINVVSLNLTNNFDPEILGKHLAKSAVQFNLELEIQKNPYSNFMFFEIDSSDWWANEWAQYYRLSLKYLDLQRQHEIKKRRQDEDCSSPRRRLSFIARLFNPWTKD